MGFTTLPSAMVACREQCLSVLDAARKQSAGFYAVIDLAASTNPGYWLDHLVSLNPVKARNLFDGQPESGVEAQAPWLVKLSHAEHHVRLRRLVDETLIAQNVSWVASSLTLDELARRLSRRLTARLSDKEVLFRFYDPRLAVTWWPTLSEVERTDFGAFGTHWWVPDMAGTLHDIELVGAPEEDPQESSWRITPTQQDALVGASECHQLVGFLGKRQPDAFFGLDRGARWRFVTGNDKRAKEHHVTRLADRLKYCELALQHGDMFADEARWHPVWAAMKDGDTRLFEAMQALSESL